MADCADTVFKSGEPDEKEHAPDEPKALAVMEVTMSGKPEKKQRKSSRRVKGGRSPSDKNSFKY